nr:MAG TPA: hypothetical protein [Caudoviricetes sp.]
MSILGCSEMLITMPFSSLSSKARTRLFPYL